MAQKHVVLLGSAGTATAFSAACSLRRSWSTSVSIVSMDINLKHLVTASLLSDEFEQVPYSTEPCFFEKILSIINKHSVDTYLPLMPQEIMLGAVIQSKRLFPATLKLIGPAVNGATACADKWVMHSLLRHAGIPMPNTSLASDKFDGEVCFLKPRCGVGSRNTTIIQANQLPTYVGQNPEEWILQEVCDKPEITVDMFWDPDRMKEFSICRERLETKAGVSTKCRLFHDQVLNDYGKRIAQTFNFSGSFCFQVMRLGSGWVITDVNPRPGGGSSMCFTVGTDFFAATFAYYWNEDPERFLVPLNHEQYVTRQYVDFLMGQA